MSANHDDLSFDEALGVWLDLERAWDGRHGYGGDVAEIYAYRLVPDGFKRMTNPALAEAAAAVAARNLTRILRNFVELHEGADIGIEDGPRTFRPINPLTEEFPPFAHRVHLRVSKTRQIREQFARDLLALWQRVESVKLPQPAFAAWGEATSDLLIALKEPPP